MERISFDKLKNADLVIDAVYESNGATNTAGDVLSKLMSVGVMSGFRRLNQKTKGPKKLAYIVLESTGKHPDWIDSIDREAGIIQYYGDNREPGRELHGTKQNGNAILRDVFEYLSNGERDQIPPFFYFESEKGRNRRFVGLLVPGNDSIKSEEQLTAIWRSKGQERYQNYKAIFTILNVSKIERGWIDDLIAGNGMNSKYAPEAWKTWIEKGFYDPLQAKDAVLSYRTPEQQMPNNAIDKKKLKRIYDYFENPYEFELCAMKIAQLMDSNIQEIEHTRYTKDGGRDAVGKYRIGKFCDGIEVEFALEAKRYSESDSVGVKEVSRLISRLRHRQFGILVTTSFVGKQAYEEIRDDGHPVIIISGSDILGILYDSGIKTAEEIDKWLKNNFPK